MIKKIKELILDYAVKILISGLLVIIPANLYAQETERTIVTVAYFEARNFMEGKTDDEFKSGYGYETLQKIAEYAGWEYKYVYGSFSDLYDKFKNGEIDLFPGLAYRKDRELYMSWSDSILDLDYHSLFVLKDDTTLLSEDYNTLSGKTVGIIRENNMSSEFIQWASNEGLDIKYRLYSSFNEMEKDLKKGNICGFIGSENNIYYSNDVKVYVRYAITESYICVRKGAPEILDRLNYAFAQIKKDDPGFFVNIRTKYYNKLRNNSSLTAQEVQWMFYHSNIKIGYTDNYMPFCGTDEDGNLTGILKDIMTTLHEQLNSSIEPQIEYVSFSDYPTMLRALEEGTVDAVFPVISNTWYSEKTGMMETNGIINSSIVAVYKNNFTENTVTKIAVNRHTPMQIVFSQMYYPDSELVYVDNEEECLRAVATDKAYCTFFNGTRIENFRSKAVFKNLEATPLGIPIEYSIGVKRGNVLFLSILNRGIALLDQNTLTHKLFSYIYLDRDYSILDFVRDHMIFVFAIIFFIVVVLMISFYSVLKSERKKEAVTKSYLNYHKKANEVLETRMGIIQSMSKIYFSSFYIDLVTDTYKNLSMIDNLTEIVEEQADAQICLYEVVNKVVSSEHVDAMKEFLDLSTINERLADKTVITTQYKGIKTGWCQAYLISGDKDKAGKLKHIFFACRMIHEEKEEEELQKKNLSDALIAAEQANRAKTRFLNNMSHDIRTPMNAIIGFTNLAQSHADEKEKVLSYLEKISTSSDHLLALINDILDMSRIESGTVKIEEKPVNLIELINDLRTIVQSTMTTKDQELKIVEHIQNQIVISDKLRINQVLLNIIGNAIKFTPNHGIIEFSIKQFPCDVLDSALYEIKIKDNGIGMSREFQKHIFESFTREQTATVSGIQGTGLGMAITKNIIDMMGGTIEVESELGKGSEFTVMLTCKIVDNVEAVSEETKESIKEESNRESHSNSILLVEDNLLNQEIAKTILEEFGYEVDVAENGLIACEKYIYNEPDKYGIILMDIQMPVMDGFEATKNIRSLEDEFKSTIPIIAMTANAFQEDRKKALEAGMDAHIAKPIDTGILLSTIKQYIR